MFQVLFQIGGGIWNIFWNEIPFKIRTFYKMFQMFQMFQIFGQYASKYMLTRWLLHFCGFRG